MRGDILKMDDSDRAFLQAFEDCTLPFSQWTHLAHVRVAFLYATRQEPDEALASMRRGIQAYNAATQTPETTTRGYHETITQAFMRLVCAAVRISGQPQSWESFCETQPQLLTKNVLDEYYSKQHLFTVNAKQQFVEPDKKPLPVFFGKHLTLEWITGGVGIDWIRTMFLEYADFLPFDLCFQGFETELAELPGIYAMPAGRLLIGYVGHEQAGCVGLRPLEPTVCELKRLWVRPTFRGTGLGRRLTEAMMAEARRMGYTKMRLDTVSTLEAAIALYRSLGFAEIEAYTDNPQTDVMFFEVNL